MSLVAALALVAGTSGTALLTSPAGAATASVPCAVDYKVQNQWDTGFTTAVTITNNGSLNNGGSVSFGFNGSYNGTNAVPAAFTLDGVMCNVDDRGTGGGTGGGGGGGTDGRVDNPYAGAKVYVNPEWSANASAEPGGSRIADQPTAVWLDRIAAISGVNGGMGLRAHLDEALKQKGSGDLVVQLVIYDLPGRDCAALASNGELAE